jgi:hypothetical protein
MSIDEDKNNCLSSYELSEFYGSFLETLIYIFGISLESSVNRSGYGFLDLPNDFNSHFFVFYLRGLDGFYFNGHFITSMLNIAIIGKLVNFCYILLPQKQSKRFCAVTMRVPP